MQSQQLAAAADALRDFIAGAQGTVCSRGDAGHAEATRIWNGAVSHDPLLVIPCRDVANVQVALTGARALGLPISVRGGGHDWAGRALRDNGVVIDLSPMRGVTIDAGTRTATVTGNATAADVAEAAAVHGLAPVVGNCGAVGAIGHLIGGGYSPLTPAFGLAADNLLSAEVVLADGRAVTADAETNPDLFWALRGGGGNFGVVTSSCIRLHPVPEVLAGVILFPWAQAETVLAGYEALLSTAADALSVTAGIICGPDGRPVVMIAPVWSGDAPVRQMIARLRDLGSPMLEQVTPMSVAGQVHLQDDYIVNGRQCGFETRWLPRLSEEAIVALMAAGEAVTSPCSMVILHHFHGAGTRVATDATPFGLRRRHIMVEIIPCWEAGDGTSHRAWGRALSTALAPHALPGGYAGVLGPDAHDQIAHAYGPGAARLCEVKRQVDPDDVFSSAIPLPR